MEHFVWVSGEVRQVKHLRDRIKPKYKDNEEERVIWGRSQSRRKLKTRHRWNLSGLCLWPHFKPFRVCRHCSWKRAQIPFLAGVRASPF